MSLPRISKEEWREAMAVAPGSDGPVQSAWGRLAQQVRGLETYRAAKRVFVDPSPVLAQIRINALVDGKELLMPAPGLKEGFYLCRPYVIPFGDLSYATTYHGLSKFGRLLDNQAVAGKAVDLLLTDAVAVDQQGTRLSDGNGFFDLACAILAELGAVDQLGAAFVAVAADEQLVSDDLPVDPWDVRLDQVVTPSGGLVFTAEDRVPPTILWPHLSSERVKRLNPLWKLSAEQRRE